MIATPRKILRKSNIHISRGFLFVWPGNGTHVLAWARTKKLLPPYVVVTESDRNKRVLLAEELKKGGYNSADGTTFIKH